MTKKLILPGNTNTLTTMKAFCQQFSNRGYSERQANGFIAEDFIYYSNSNYSKSVNQKYNTSEFDCYSKNYNMPVQIKAKKISRGILCGLHGDNLNIIKPTQDNLNNIVKTIQIELGSGNNGHLYKDTDFILDIVAYNTHNMTVNRVVFYIDHIKWNNAINPRNNEILSKDHVFSGISNDRSDDAKWRKRRTEIATEYNDAYRAKNMDFVFRPRFKRDHDKQERIQMAISDKDLFKLSSGVYIDDNFKYKIK